jgi:hypothetical protein
LPVSDDQPAIAGRCTGLEVRAESERDAPRDIVETPGSPYFFKITGDAATVHGAPAPLVALLDSITPS